MGENFWHSKHSFKYYKTIPMPTYLNEDDPTRYLLMFECKCGVKWRIFRHNFHSTRRDKTW